MPIKVQVDVTVSFCTDDINYVLQSDISSQLILEKNIPLSPWIRQQLEVSFMHLLILPNIWASPQILIDFT